MSETYSDDGTAEELAESDAENNELIGGEWNATDKAYRPLVKELASLRQQLAEAQRDKEAAVEDFKRRAIEVCRKNWWEFGKYIVEEIESLPLIGESHE